MNRLSNEKSRKYQSSILCLLLKRYEKSNAFKTEGPVVQRPQFAMKALKDPLTKDYSDEMDYQKKEAIHQAACELQSLGIIDIKWAKFKEGMEIEKLYLQPTAIDAAYQQAGIVPRKKLMEDARKQILPLAGHPWDWVRDFWKYYDEALEKYQTKGLQIDDPDSLGDLVKAFIYLPETEDGVMKRVLSHRLFNDTKHFEQNVQAKLVAVLKRFAKLELDTERELLDSVGIVENPVITLLSGPLIIGVKDGIVDIGNMPGGTGIFFETILEMSIDELRTDTVLLIENLTAYHLYLQKKLKEEIPDTLKNPEKVLTIYTGGFPHHALRKLLLKLRDFRINPENPPVNVFHWGDIDYGGIMIFEHIKKSYFPDLISLLMDDVTYRKYVKEGLPFSKEYEAKLISISENAKYEAWWPVVKMVIDKGRILEQEGIVVEKQE